MKSVTPFGASKYRKDELAMAWTFYSATGEQMIIDGGVDTTGTPANNQIAVFTDVDTLEGTTGLTFDADGTNGYFTVLNSGSGSTDFKVESSATSGSTPARVILRTGDGNTADTWISFHGVNTYEYSVGVDNSDSDKFKISGSALGTNDKFIIDPIGAITMPLQPSFLAFNSADNANVTGNGTEVTVEFNTEVFDQNADYNNSTDTFTAPVTGRYLFAGAVTVGGMAADSASTGYVKITASNRSARHTFDTGSSANAAGGGAFACIVDMDAADTCLIKFSISGVGGDTADIKGDSSLMQTYFSGQLVA